MLLLLALQGGKGAPPKSPDAYHLRAGDVVLFLGDSITAESRFFWQIFYEDLPKRYPELVMEGGKPGKDFKGPGVRFVNAGASGDTASGGLARLPKLLEQHKPTAAVVCFGMNDRIQDRPTYADHLRALVRALKEARVSVTILTSPCVYPLRKQDLQPWVPILGEMAAEARKIAAEERVLFADCYAPTRKRVDDNHDDFTWGDGIHPNVEGHRIIADALQSAWGFGKPLAKGGGPRAVPDAPAPEKPAPEAAAPARPAWVDITGNAGGDTWMKGGVTQVFAVPGTQAVIAGVNGSGLWVNEAQGSFWQPLTADPKERMVSGPCQVILDPANPLGFWMCSRGERGAVHTIDRGRRLTRLGTLMPISCLGVDLTDPARMTLLAGLHDQDLGLYKSSDGGKTWENIGQRLPAKSGSPSYLLVLDASTYVVSCAGSNYARSHWIVKSTDGGFSWNKVNLRSGATGPPLLASDGSIYWCLDGQRGLMKSADKGETWTVLPGPARGLPVELPDRKLVSWAETQLHVSKDGGKTWEAWGPTMPAGADGIIYSAARKALFSWRSTDRRVPEAILRWDLP
jgi:lysophospholipase L1-like esterase